VATEVGLAQGDLVTGSPPARQLRTTRARRKVRPVRILMFVIMAVVAVVMLYPFFYMLVNSFKTQAQYQLGTGFSLASWRLLFSSQPILRELLNSLLVSCAGKGE